MPKSPKPLADVFLNIPYDKPFQNLCLAYISGISAFGLVPRATLEIPSGARRLDRILQLIQACQYSVHDLSRVELDAKRPPTPRFNMPFELGLSVAWTKISSSEHTWFVYESRIRRLSKSLSDLDGTDAHIHSATVKGVFRELCNAFVGEDRHPTIQQMRKIYQDVTDNLPVILKQAGTHTIYTARSFKDICIAARDSAGRNVPISAARKRVKRRASPGLMQWFSHKLSEDAASKPSPFKTRRFRHPQKLMRRLSGVEGWPTRL